MKRIMWITVAGCVILAIMGLAACGTAAVTPDPDAPKPSKPGGVGEALKLTGDAEAGEEIFNSKCKECHGPDGKGGVLNSGSEDGSVPALNPADEFYNPDPAVFAANLDVFIEHGSTPAGDSPTRIMLGYGDLGMLAPQEIADVIAFIIQLNQKE